MQVQHYIHRATDFLEGMQLTRTDESYWNSSALLAIHSAVSYSDALRLGLGDQKVSADDHQKSADSLQKLLASKHLEDRAGFKHLRFLLSKKNLWHTATSVWNIRITRCFSQKLNGSHGGPTK